MNALHFAAENGHTNIVELLLSKLTGEDLTSFIQTQDGKRRNALHFAAGNRDEHMTLLNYY